LIELTSSPAILDARTWLEDYHGENGPKLDLSQAAPPYLPAEQLVHRLSEIAAIPEVARYGPVSGEYELRSAYAAHTSKLYQAAISPDHVAITAGCNQAFFIAAMLSARSGEAIIVCTPYYFNHRMTLDMLGITAIEAPCRPEDRYVPDPSSVAALIHEGVRAIVLVTPNNPTGSIYPPAAIEAFGMLCRERNIWLIIDETYRDFLPEGRPHNLFDDNLRTNVISLYSFSKALAIPGYRLGAMTFPARLANAVTKVQDCIQICPARVGQIGATWALRELDPWRAAKRAELVNKARDFSAIMQGVAGWQVASIGSYFAYVRHPFAKLTGKDVSKRLARQNGLLLIPGSYFGSDQERYLRLSFGNLTAENLGSLPGRFIL
jgi:aspartate/methionine/tyrosine aminotransferase